MLLNNLLDSKPQIQKHLFEKGYLITDASIPNPKDYPFYDNWTDTPIGA